jgi:hypothetical protein
MAVDSELSGGLPTNCQNWAAARSRCCVSQSKNGTSTFARRAFDDLPCPFHADCGDEPVSVRRGSGRSWKRCSEQDDDWSSPAIHDDSTIV